MKNIWKYLVLCVVFILLLFILVTRAYNINSSTLFNGFFNNVYKKIDYVEVVGNDLVSTDDIISTLYNIDAQDKFILKDKHQIVEGLQKIELIESVMLKYTLPSKLIITIKERTPTMFYHTEYLNVQIIDSNFNEFFDERVDLEHLVYIRGKYNKEQIQSLIKMLQEFPLIYNNITEIENFFGYRFNIVLNNKIQILLPEKNTKDALSRLEKYILKYNVLKTNIYRIDFRNKDKVFFSSDAKKTVYEPEKMKYIVYKTQTRNEKYHQIIQNAISKI